MEWLFAIGILVLLVVSPGFRAIVFYGLLGLGVFIWYQGGENEKEREKEETLVQTNELVYTEPFIATENGYSHKYMQRITNPTSYNVNYIRIKITYRECETCVVIKEDSVYIAMRIPPGQARDISQYVTPPNNKYVWNWIPQSVTASEVDPT